MKGEITKYEATRRDSEENEDKIFLGYFSLYGWNNTMKKYNGTVQ